MKKASNKIMPFIKNKLSSKYLTRFITYKGKIITIGDSVYFPSYDTIFFLENLKINKNEKILDLGTGTGILSIFCSDFSKNITAIDSSKKAISCAKLNTMLNNASDKIQFKAGNWFEPVQNKKFDLIITDPPQQPTPPKVNFSYLIKSAYDSGPDGRKALNTIISQGINYLNEKGRIIIYHAQFANIQKSISLAHKIGYSKVKIIAKGTGEFGRTSGERINYFKSIGIKIKKKNGNPVLEYYLLQLEK